MGANTYKYISIETSTNTSDKPSHEADIHVDTYIYTAQAGIYRFMDTGHNPLLPSSTQQRGARTAGRMQRCDTYIKTRMIM